MAGRGCLLVIWWDISYWQKDGMAHPLDPFFKTGRNERNVWNELGTSIFPSFFSAPNFLGGKAWVSVFSMVGFGKSRGFLGAVCGIRRGFARSLRLCFVCTPTLGLITTSQQRGWLKQRELQAHELCVPQDLVSVVPILNLPFSFLLAPSCAFYLISINHMIGAF